MEVLCIGLKLDCKVDGHGRHGCPAIAASRCTERVEESNESAKVSETDDDEKSDESLDLSVKSMLTLQGDIPKSASPPTSSSQLSLLSSSLLPATGASPLNLLVKYSSSSLF